MVDKIEVPEIERAQDVLGLSLDEIARALEVNPSTLYRTRAGKSLNSRSLERLRRLDEFAADVRAVLPRAVTPDWLDAPASVFDGKSPRQMIREGRTEMVHGALLAIIYVLRVLEAVDEGRSHLGDLLARKNLPLSTKAAIALVDRQLEDLIDAMQTEQSRDAAARVFDSTPRVRLRNAGGAAEPH